MNYEINYDTEIILPLDKNSCKVVENGNQYIIDATPFAIIERSCEYFGSSYEGRKLGTKMLLGITHKSPIIVEESKGIIFFPTKSPDKEDCIWVNLAQIEKFYEVDERNSAIEFKNGDVLECDTSIGSLSNQIMRSTRLKFILDERTKLKKI